jgi:hypothetical protein
MTPEPDGKALSDYEHDVLSELEWQLEQRDPGLRLVAGLFLIAVGAVLALVAFTVFEAVAIGGLAMMGIGLGVGVVPGVHRLRKRVNTDQSGRA